MTDADWKLFFLICAKVLGAGRPAPGQTKSWCAWTTFRRLSEDAGYWGAELPKESDICSTHIADGGPWGQPFEYAEIAHVLVPARFSLEVGAGTPNWRVDDGKQDLDRLSAALHDAGIPHRKTEMVLEIKCY
ncbi:hypothetical protein E4K72_19810 [Oxalobacteraceae bacterium OM1]|nr:hypothetical protein E4K72_19810 [Oxalobacteraceae bacterium OM1]